MIKESVANYMTLLKEELPEGLRDNLSMDDLTGEFIRYQGADREYVIKPLFSDGAMIVATNAPAGTGLVFKSVDNSTPRMVARVLQYSTVDLPSLDLQPVQVMREIHESVEAVKPFPVYGHESSYSDKSVSTRYKIGGNDDRCKYIIISVNSIRHEVVLEYNYGEYWEIISTLEYPYLTGKQIVEVIGMLTGKFFA